MSKSKSEDDFKVSSRIRRTIAHNVLRFNYDELDWAVLSQVLKGFHLKTSIPLSLQDFLRFLRVSPELAVRLHSYGTCSRNVHMVAAVNDVTDTYSKFVIGVPYPDDDGDIKAQLLTHSSILFNLGE